MKKIYLLSIVVMVVATVTLPEAHAQVTSGCFTIDWETDCNGNPFQAGHYVQPNDYDCIGVTITNGLGPNHPIVLFDSDNPTGGDTDLGTPSSNCPSCVNPCPGMSNDPNGGLTNCSPAGLTLITEENPSDNNNDGLEDVPDDFDQSLYTFCFDAPVTISTLDFLDDSNGFLNFTHFDGSTSSALLIGGLDNDQFTQVFDVSDVMCMEVEYTTSGALALVNFCYDDPNNMMCDLVAPVLGGDIAVCQGTDPGPVEVLQPATGTGTIMYEWQQSLVGCSGGFGAIPGASSSTYNPGPLVQDTYIKVLVTTNDGTQVCVDESNCISYRVTNTPSVILNDPGDICPHEGLTTLTATPEGGVYSGTGIINANTGVFDPAVAGLGTHTITYTFMSGSCSGSDQVDIMVSESPSATLTFTNPDCGESNGTITFTYPTSVPGRSHIDLSIDGGLSYVEVPLASGSFTFTNLRVETYDTVIRWDDDTCLLDLPDVTLIEDQTPSCYAITIIRN